MAEFQGSVHVNSGSISVQNLFLNLSPGSRYRNHVLKLTHVFRLRPQIALLGVLVTKPCGQSYLRILLYEDKA